jgi:prepilin-type N-terminal cleavage/methylation domain-containing protein
VRPPRGMTLIEMMVGLLIVLIMMTFIGTIYVGSMRVRSRTQQVSEFTSTARGALDLLRRDLTGAFRLAVRTYDFGTSYRSGAEFHWEAPVVPGNPTSGFRRVSFITAMDGSRQFEKNDDGTWRSGDPLGPHEYDLVSWAVRGGALFRQVGTWRIGIRDEDLPVGGWNACPDPDDPDTKGVGVGEFVYSDDTVPFVDVGAYGGTPYIKTNPAADPPPIALTVKDSNGDPVPVTVTVGFEEGRAVLPGWASGFRALGEKIVASSVTFDLYAKDFPDSVEDPIALGSNESGTWMYFVMLEPLGWSLGEEARSLVFYPPASYGLAADRDGDGTWEDGEAGETPDGIWSGPVPRYLDVKLTIRDEKMDRVLADGTVVPGTRIFGQRIGVPTGEGP